MEQSNPARHILVVRNSAMGDVAMLPHAIRALKSAYPDVRITVATRRLFEPFFRDVEVDFLFMDTRGEHSGVKGIYNFARQVCALGVDAVADMHYVLRSVLLSSLLRCCGIRVAQLRKGRVEKWFRVGYSRVDAVPLRHTVGRYCDVFRRLGFEFDDPQPITVKPHYDNPMGEKCGTWVGFAPFSAHEGKTYPADMREDVVARLAEHYDRVFVHSGGGQESEFACAMERKYPNVVAVAPRLKLAEEIALISHLDCVVSMDSLVMHLCALTATPVVSVWGATHPELGFLGYGADTEGVLQVEMPCRPCSTYGSKPCKFGDCRCLRAITPEKVVERVEYLISKYREVE